MLPFLKPKRETGIITKIRQPDGQPMQEESADDDSSDYGLKACAADLIRAVHAKDEDGVANAIRAAFELLESRPHEENSEQETE